MSFETQINELTFATNGATTAFGLSGMSGALYFMAADDIHAVYTTAAGAQSLLGNGSGFTVSGDGRTGSGTLTTTGTLAAGSLRIWCDTPIVQPEQYTENAGFPAATHETAQDRGRMIDRDIYRRLGRAVRLSDFDALTDMTLPVLAARRNKVAVFNNSGRIVNSALDASVLDDLAGTIAAVHADKLAADASAAAAAASAAVALVVRAYLDTHPLPYFSMHNIFDVIANDAIITAIRAGSYNANLDTYFQAACTIGGTWFLPEGTYKFVNNTLSLPPGMEFRGAGIGRTVLFLGGDPWGMEQLNGTGFGTVEGCKLRDMTVQCSNHGIRWNSIAGGFTDDGTTQLYIARWMIERCQIVHNSGAAGFTGIQINKCFNGGISASQFLGFSVPVNFEGSDINWLDHVRFDLTQSGCILIHSHGSFGSSTLINHCDFNDPKDFIIRSSDLDLMVYDSHFEMDGPAGSTGIGGNMEAAIDILSGTFHFKIVNNRMQVGVFCDNWLRVAPTDIIYYAECRGQTSSGPTGGVKWDYAYYFNNSGGRTYITHGENTDGFATFPMNTRADGAPLPSAKMVALWTPSRRGLYFGLTPFYNPPVQSGDLFLTPLAAKGSLIELSDFIVPLKGTYDITCLAYGAAAGQQFKFEIFNGGASIATGTCTCTALNVSETFVLGTAQATPDGLRVQFYNDDTATDANVYLQVVTVENS